MKPSKLALVLIAASAAQLSMPVLRVSAADSANKVYLKFDGGANIMQDVTVEDIRGSRKVKFDTGGRLDILGGYNLNNWAAVELETGLMFNSIKSTDQTINFNNVLNNLDIWSYTVPVLANVVLRYESESKFVPYIGGGAGGAFTTYDGLGRDDNTDVVFAYQFKAGVGYNISEKVAIDLGYKLFGTSEQDYGGTKVTDVMSHFIGLGLTWKL